MTPEKMRELDGWIIINAMGWNPRLEKSKHNSKYVCVLVNNTMPMAVAGKAYKYSDSEICIGSFDPIEHPDWTALAFVKFLRFQPTADSAAAFDLLKKCADKLDQPDFSHGILITRFKGVYLVSAVRTAPAEAAPTLELAICFFAKKLFSK